MHGGTNAGRRVPARRLVRDLTGAGRARRYAVLTGRLGFLRLGSTSPSRRTSLGRSPRTSLMRAPVAQSVVSSNRSRSQAAAAITAWTSWGDKPSGGCQRLPVGLTERRVACEFDSTRCDAPAEGELGREGLRPVTRAEFNTPIGRLNSPFPPAQPRAHIRCSRVVSADRRCATRYTRGSEECGETLVGRR